MSLTETCTPNGHLYRVTHTRCRTDTINSPDDGHVAARNMYRIEIKIHEKELCVKLVIYKDCTEMHSQQNIKFHYDIHVILLIMFMTHAYCTSVEWILFL